jgi:hypothetical protein
VPTVDEGQINQHAAAPPPGAIDQVATSPTNPPYHSTLDRSHHAVSINPALLYAVHLLQVAVSLIASAIKRHLFLPPITTGTAHMPQLGFAGSISSGNTVVNLLHFCNLCPLQTAVGRKDGSSTTYFSKKKTRQRYTKLIDCSINHYLGNGHSYK